MVVVAALVALGALCVCFLLRFLFALEVEARQQKGRIWQTRGMRRSYLHVSAAAGNPARGLTLAYCNPKLISAPLRSGAKLIGVEKLRRDPELRSRRG